MKDGNWIALHKELVHFLPHGRPYTLLEAVFSYTLDIDNGKEGTIKGYANLWGWSRTKVRRLINNLKTPEGHLSNTHETPTRHRILLKINNLQNPKDTHETPKRHPRDTHRATTNYPNPKPDTKEKGKAALSPEDLVKGWNEICGSEGLSKILKITKDRRAKINARLREHSTVKFWTDVINEIPNQPFLMGKNDRQWKADFDWLIANDTNAVKILEGKYKK